MFVCVTPCIYGAYSGILCLDFVTCIVTSLFSGSFGWIDLCRSNYKKVVDVVMGYIWYRSNALCIQ
jgi:hypothetical protein